MGLATSNIAGNGQNPASATGQTGVGGLISVDAATGAVLTYPRALNPGADGIASFAPLQSPDAFVTVTSTDTTYVASDTIDCGNANRISCVTKVTTNAGGATTRKLQWSFDNSNWWDDTDSTATVITTAFAGGTAGYDAASGSTTAVRARYARIASKSSGAATTVTAEHHFSLL